MTLTVYATADDLTGATPPWVTDPPDDVDSLLRSASLLVAQAAGRNPYGDDPTGDTADVLRDATCAQVASWAALGVTPAALGLDDTPVKTAQLGTGMATYDTSVQATALQSAVSGLVPEASAILYNAGLLVQLVPVGPSEDCLPSWGLDHEPRWPVRWPFE